MSGLIMEGARWDEKAQVRQTIVISRVFKLISVF